MNRTQLIHNFNYITIFLKKFSFSHWVRPITITKNQYKISVNGIWLDMHIVVLDNNTQIPLHKADINTLLDNCMLTLGSQLSIMKLHNYATGVCGVCDSSILIRNLEWFSLLLPFIQKYKDADDFIAYLLDLSKACKLFIKVLNLNKIDYQQMVDYICSKYTNLIMYSQSVMYDPLDILKQHLAIPMDFNIIHITPKVVSQFVQNAILKNQVYFQNNHFLDTTLNAEGQTVVIRIYCQKYNICKYFSRYLNNHLELPMLQTQVFLKPETQDQYSKIYNSQITRASLKDMFTTLFKLMKEIRLLNKNINQATKMANSNWTTTAVKKMRIENDKFFITLVNKLEMYRQLEQNTNIKNEKKDI